MTTTTTAPKLDHSTQAGRACVDGGDGCCRDCGVALVPCDCGGTGYHTTDCVLLDFIEEEVVGLMLEPPRVPSFVAETIRP